MNTDNLTCLGNQRRMALRGSRSAYGIDSVHFEKSAYGSPELIVVLTSYWNETDLSAARATDPKPPINIESVVIEGGLRIRDVRAVAIHGFVNDEARGGVGAFRVQLNQAGDPSRYTLRLIRSVAEPDEAPLGFDRRFAQAEFRFCTSGVAQEDCAPEACPALDDLPLPPIDYLAKDYASFRKLMLDRLSQTIPQWTERSPADLGVTIVEVLAYHADHLSYFQDAVATEAYLQTARRRLSVRRHARLVDYRLHEGCNSRAWVFVQVNDEVTVGPEWAFFTSPTNPYRRDSGNLIRRKQELRDAQEHDRIVFEPVQVAGQPEQVLYPAHNELQIYTWGDEECCLPEGSTAATLTWDKNGGPVHLQAGDLLLFEEVLGPRTGLAADADSSHRHVVRLTRVRYTSDVPPRLQPGDNNKTATLAQQPSQSKTSIVEVLWDVQDALPFALCVCTGKYRNVGIARGNLVLVDQGLSQSTQDLLQIPHTTDVESLMDDRQCLVPKLGTSSGITPFRRFQSFPLPALADKRLTYTTPFPNKSLQARTQARQLARWLAEAKTGRALVRFLRDASDVKDVSDEALAETVGSILTRVTILLRRTEAGQPIVYEDSDLKAARDQLNEFHTKAQETESEFADRWAWTLDLNLIGPATADLQQDAQTACAVFELQEVVPGESSDSPIPWKSVPDLLHSEVEDRHFVFEIDDAEEHGTYQLRFGDGRHGIAPWPGSKFECLYREGCGTSGNVGAEAIRSLVGERIIPPGVQAVRNPLPASGGVDPEPTTEARVRAPQHFRAEIVRAITPDDYARLAERDERVQQATAVMAWTGTGYDVQVAVDLRAAALRSAANPILEEAIIRGEIEGLLQRYRRIGHEVRVVPARYVPLQLELQVCVKPHAQQGQVRRLVRETLSNRTLDGGRQGFFHPDRLTFGQSIEASAVIAEVQAISDVDAVKLVVLRRLFGPGQVGHNGGTLNISPIEIARLDNDLAFPENGRLLLTMRGGR
jgi:predicted phage baseplate assembly protein